MPNVVLLGGQWGDEGKGKVIDLLAREADWVVRYQGGSNAGHTVEVGAEKYVLHLVPSGILHPGKKCVIGNGVVVDPVALAQELDDLARRGIKAEGRLFLSDRAHLVFPYHRALDEAREAASAPGKQIGTTKRGIGPAYADKAARVGLRVCDMLEEDFAERVRDRLEENNRLLRALGASTLDQAVLTPYLKAAQRLVPLVTDTALLLHEALARGESILFEGAQGTLLDLDHGTYPFVTSSSASVGGAFTGTGVPPRWIHQVIGVVKAYTTRVGEGPFPTECRDGTGEFLREEGGEFGATTGRARRCGWFDAVVARYAARLNGVDGWAVTKLDVLDRLAEVKICVAYECGGRHLESVPAHARTWARCTPVYEVLPGWQEPTRSARSFDQLPRRAQAYVRRIEELTGVPVRIVSVGPERDSAFFRR